MADKTGISWTDATWNPIRGCSRVSKGCENCYAEKVAHRFSGPGQPYEGLTRDGRWSGEIKLVPEKLDEPLRWKKPRLIFVNSMSDLFHEGVPDEYIAAVFGVMAASPQHTFQILTKRPERMREWFRWVSRGPVYMNNWVALGDAIPIHRNVNHASETIPGEQSNPLRIGRWDRFEWPLPNVHLGVSVENQETADERIPLLLQTPAEVRFISAEPLLAGIDLECFGETGCPTGWLSEYIGLDWVIVGGESGPGARPCDVAAIRSIVEQCRGARVQCFVKQLGAIPMLSCQDGDIRMRLNPKARKGDDPSEWPDDLRIRNFPQ